MVSILLLGLAALINLTGCILLALSQKKHAATVFGRGAKPLQGRATRFVGWTLLVIALLLSLLGDRPGFAVLYWLMSVTGSAMVVVLLLALKPEWLSRAAHIDDRGQRL